MLPMRLETNLETWFVFLATGAESWLASERLGSYATSASGTM
jgi:hypothetical protein